jgi:hypothetical protein
MNQHLILPALSFLLAAVEISSTSLPVFNLSNLFEFLHNNGRLLFHAGGVEGFNSGKARGASWH